MSDFKKIMVAVAFSPYTEGIFQYAARLASSLNTDLVITNIINKRDVSAIKRLVQLGYEVDSNHYIRGMKEERQQILNQLLQNNDIDPEKIKIIFKVGNPVRDLLDVGIAENVDMIIMGIKARTGLEHILIGSVAEKVFRRSPITVVSYREENLAKRMRKRLKNK
ncbi:MAG: universal stress protein [Desulfobacula sp.]|jgi:nucleotide-binding universal stress UspA family protein|nr:universal stress protein [Desulfobacula sp.]